MKNIRKIMLPPSVSILETMEAINRGAAGIALLVDDERRLIGTITDGDIRRAVMSGLSLHTSVKILLSRKAARYPTPITAHFRAKKSHILSLMHKHVVRQIPLLDDEGRVVELVLMDELLPEQILPLQAVVMAGGFGTRLRPLTEELPKPMLPVGERPLLELIIEQLREADICRVNITTHYKPEKITDYFGDGQKFGVELNYVNENMPLGTAGALGLMEMPLEPLLVINGDILTQVDFRAMQAYHRTHQADLTVAVRQYDFQVPYGVLECDGPYVLGLREKPSYNFFVNAGIYLLQPTVHHYIPRNQRFDMTDLIETLISAGKTVVSFPIVEYWLDIGQHTDYQQAQEDLQSGRLD